MRPARADEAAALTALERRASTAALAHVFDPVAHPYPHSQVERRWEDLLGESGVSVLVQDAAGASGDLAVLVAHDAERVRHLAVDPGSWGSGLGDEALAAAAAAIRAGGVRPRLRCLAENHRALGFYGRRGWVRSGVEARTEWPPYPLEVELLAPAEP